MTSTASPAIRQEIEAADDERIRAKIQRDQAAMERVIADDLVYVHSTAYTEGKSTLIAGIMAGRVLFRSMTRSDVTVRDFGNLALLCCKVVIEFEMGGAARSAHSRIVSAWVKRDGRWQMAHYHSTTIPPK